MDVDATASSAEISGTSQNTPILIGDHQVEADMIMRSSAGGSATGTRRYALALLCALPLLLAGARPSDDWAPIRNVIIVTLDTTRADYLPAYGFANLEAPALDRLAREGTVFEQATTSAPLTLPAHCTIFTGLFPPHHRVRDNADRPLADNQTTLAEVLRARGMRTAAFVGSIVVGENRGLSQGFDHYSAPSRTDPRERYRRPGQMVVDDALAWLTRQEDHPFFAWVHLYDAHAPYALEEPYRTMYEDAPYLGALAVLDAQVARLVEALDARHVLDRTLLIIASDHGESLGDHGEDSHGIFVYQSTLRVPLIMRVPGLAPSRIADVTRLADVMPTVLDLLHVPGPSMDGLSLLPLMTGRTTHLDLEAYSESAYPRRFGWSELHALRAGRYKFINAPRPELYDLEVDPNERHNIFNERAALGSVMAARVDALAQAAVKREPMSAAVDAESASRLAALGYVGHGAVSVPRAGSGEAAAIDPKDCIGRYNDIARARGADATGPPAADANAPNQECGSVVLLATPRYPDRGASQLSR
jgi:arylsulfatase A-like enzyme